MSISIRDFQPVNVWMPDCHGPCYYSGEPLFLKDASTGRHYLNETKTVVGFKCFLLALGTPFVHPITACITIAFRILKLITLAHFWITREDEKNYNFSGRLLHATKDFLRIVAAPLMLVGFELSALYGLIRPYDGRKLYASLERTLYGSWILAPCFQPKPTSHAFGGDLYCRNAF